eukprot:1287435-Karenia_brevis.AAC.1
MLQEGLPMMYAIILEPSKLLQTGDLRGRCNNNASICVLGSDNRWKKWNNSGTRSAKVLE